MPVIYPEPGKGPEMARLLLSMTNDPHSVGVTNEGGLGFVVTDELEQVWLDSLRPPVAEEPEPEPETPVAVPDRVPAPAPVRKNRK